MTEWYWRPNTGTWGDGSGTSYDNAFSTEIQLKNALQSGDTAWVCGTHNAGGNDRSVKVFGLQDVVVRFDHADRGSMRSGGDAAVVIRDSSNVTVVGLDCQPGAGKYSAGVRVYNSEMVTIFGAFIDGATTEAVGFRDGSQLAVIRGAVIRNSGNGVVFYSNHGLQNGQQVGPWDRNERFLVEDCDIRHIDGSKDSHGVGYQGASHGTVRNCFIQDTAGGAIVDYWWGGEHENRQNLIENCTVVDTRYVDGHTSPHGVEFGGGNYPTEPGQRENNELRGCLFVNLDPLGVAVRVKGTKGAPPAAPSHLIHGNAGAQEIRVDETWNTGEPVNVWCWDNPGARYTGNAW